jgi:phenylpropionate dioxygenase-like ring-hydroxylating dioxygenase large terminal subunit
MNDSDLNDIVSSESRSEQASARPKRSASRRGRVQGGAYGLPPGQSNDELTRVGPGTPCGEFMRRYWHPVGVSSLIGTTPKKVRVLGEDLVLFRDRKGRPGLLHARCCHRGTTLYYGKVEDEGIRCCYHGWLFDVNGQCLEQPCEPEGGTRRHKVRQPWYPVQERYGLIFAYMGPLDRMPALPRYDTLENLGPGEFLEQDTMSFYTGGPMELDSFAPFNWLQNFENVVDSYHVLILHSRFTGIQFRKEFDIMPKVNWSLLDHGVAARSLRSLPNGKTFDRITQVLLPNIRVVPSIQLTPGQGREVAWLVPIDDTHHHSFGVARVSEAGLYTSRSRHADHNGKMWGEMTEEEHQQYPDDYEAQLGQGAITFHNEEHLTTSDKGVIMLRKLLTQQIRAVAAGADPVGHTMDEAQALIKVKAGNFFVEEP